MRFESDDQARARGSAARHDALSATVAGCTASAKVLAMLQQAVAHELVVSFGEPTVSLAKRHLKLGLQYLEMGYAVFDDERVYVTRGAEVSRPFLGARRGRAFHATAFLGARST